MNVSVGTSNILYIDLLFSCKKVDFIMRLILPLTINRKTSKENCHLVSALKLGSRTEIYSLKILVQSSCQ